MSAAVDARDTGAPPADLEREVLLLRAEVQDLREDVEAMKAGDSSIRDVIFRAVVAVGRVVRPEKRWGGL